jgi:hypothetical protein
VRGGLRPASLIQRKAPHGKWKWYDYSLFDAVHRVDDELCRECGLPVYICRSEESDIQIDVRVDYCAGDVAIERKRKSLTPEGGVPPSGATYSAEPYSLSGKPLSSYREPYWTGVLEARKEKAEERQQQIAAYTNAG